MVRWAVFIMRAFQILMSPFGVEVVCGAPRLVRGFGFSKVVRKLCPASRCWDVCIVFFGFCIWVGPVASRGAWCLPIFKVGVKVWPVCFVPLRGWNAPLELFKSMSAWFDGLCCLCARLKYSVSPFGVEVVCGAPWLVCASQVFGGGSEIVSGLAWLECVPCAFRLRIKIGPVASWGA